MQRKLNGGTTIAGTMLLAHLAGIKVFATGGLGGVHRGAEISMDISADLTELGRTPVAVISSGCKSFLDIPRTLEYLETQGVGVSTFADGREGRVDFPAFWTRDSGVPSPLVVDDERTAAAMIGKSIVPACLTDKNIDSNFVQLHKIPYPSHPACSLQVRFHLNTRFPRLRWMQSLLKLSSMPRRLVRPGVTIRPSSLREYGNLQEGKASQLIEH